MIIELIPDLQPVGGSLQRPGRDKRRTRRPGMVDVGVVIRVVHILKRMEQLRVIFTPAQQGVVYTVVDTPLYPLHVSRLAPGQDTDPVSGMGRQQIAHTLRT